MGLGKLRRQHERRKAKQRRPRGRLPDLLGDGRVTGVSLTGLPVIEQPSDMSAWSPKEEYDFVDLGSGKDAPYSRYILSQHPDWNVLAVDPGFEKTRIDGNLEQVKAKAHEVLERLPDGSVSTVNADYFFNFEAVAGEYADRIMRLLQRKLKPDGNLLIGYPKTNEPYILGLLGRFGFHAGEPGIVKPTDPEYTPDARDTHDMQFQMAAQDLPQELMGRLGDMFQPMRIEAKLRDR